MVDLSRCCVVGTLVFLLFAAAADEVHSGNILGYLVTPGRSHFIIHHSLLRGLAAKGHNVTVVGIWPIADKPTENYRYIQLPIDTELMDVVHTHTMDSAENKFQGPITIYRVLSAMMLMLKKSLQSVEVERLKQNEHFDLVVYGAFFNDFQLGLSAHFQCPSVIISGAPVMQYLRDLVGAPSSVAYARYAITADGTSVMSFKERLVNYLIESAETVCTAIMEYVITKPYYEELYPSTRYQSLTEARNNVSLVFVNSHISQGNTAATVPAVIGVSGIHIKPQPDPLPSDVQQWLDGATHGAIFFSLGTNVKSTMVSSEKRDAILAAFAKLKQRILWKWEDGDLPNKPDNVMIGAWLPQDGILAHPNVRVFFSHCGKGSVNEAKFHGVPILGMPMFGDQAANLVSIRDEGWAVEVDFNTFNEETLSAGLAEILSNATYRDVVKKAADFYRDRPEHPLDTAVFWVEYVLRHNGARHLQSHAVHMNWFQLNSYDVLAVIFGTIYVAWWCLKLLFYSVKWLVFRKKTKVD